MGRFIDWVQGERSTGSVINETLIDVGEAAIEGACSLRAKFPRTFRKGGILTPVMDRLCYEGGYDVPPGDFDDSFEGGQCCDKTYIVTVSYRLVNCRGRVSSGLVESGREVEVTGKIKGIGFGKPVASSSNNLYIEFERCDGSIGYKLFASTTAPKVDNCDSIDPESRDYNRVVDMSQSDLQIDSVVTKDGSLDNCGNLGGLPPDLDSSGDDDFSRTVVVCGTPQDPSDQRCVEVTIDFEKSLDDNGNQCFLIDEKRYCFTPDGVYGDDKNNDEEQDEEEEAETIERIKYVTTTITTFPKGAKTILSDDPSDNTYFAGYFSWIIGTESGLFRTPEIPIRKERQIFVNIYDATDYNVYTVNGAVINDSVITEEVEI